MQIRTQLLLNIYQLLVYTVVSQDMILFYHDGFPIDILCSLLSKF